MSINLSFNLELGLSVNCKMVFHHCMCVSFFEKWDDWVLLQMWVYMKIRNVWFWIVWFCKSLNCEFDVQYVLVFYRAFWSDFPDLSLLILLLCVVLWWITRLLKMNHLCVVIFHSISNHGLLGCPMYIDHNKTRGILGLIHMTNKRGNLAKVFRVTIFQVWARLDDKKNRDINWLMVLVRC